MTPVCSLAVEDFDQPDQVDYGCGLIVCTSEPLVVDGALGADREEQTQARDTLRPSSLRQAAHLPKAMAPAGGASKACLVKVQKSLPSKNLGQECLGEHLPEHDVLGTVFIGHLTLYRTPL